MILFVYYCTKDKYIKMYTRKIAIINFLETQIETSSLLDLISGLEYRGIISNVYTNRITNLQ